MYVFEFQKKLKTAWGTELKCYRNDLLKEKWYCMDYSADHDKKSITRDILSNNFSKFK